LVDRTPVTAIVRSGGLTPSEPGAAAELLAFNASVRRAGERMAVCPFRRGVASSEAESIRFLEGRLATLELGGDVGCCRGSWRVALERGGDCPAGLRGLGRAALCTWAVDWASLSPFLSFGLERDCWSSWAYLPNMCFAFKGRLGPMIRVPLIMVPDSSPRAFVGMSISPAEA
jgi:hypothetical protein